MLEILVVQLIIMDTLIGIICGFAVGYAMGCHKRGDYTK